MNPPRASPPRPSLATLPIEVLTQIAQHLPRSSAISFAGVARCFALPAEHRIWRQLDLFLHPNFGELALVQPHAPQYRAHYAWAQTEARAAEDRHRDGLRDKVKRILTEGSGRRFGMVEKVVVIPRPGAITGIISLLDLISPNLTTLELDAPTFHSFAAVLRPADCDTLDVQILNCRVSFPALTHLRIHKQSIRFAEFLTVLRNAAPNLFSLDANIAHNLPSARHVTAAPLLPAPNNVPTRLRYLRLAFRETRQTDPGEVHPVVSIIASSPELQSLSLHRISFGRTWSPIISAICHMGALRDLHLSMTLAEFSQYIYSWPGTDFPCLRRLVLNQNQELEFFRHFPPALPALQSLYLQQPQALIPTWPETTAFPSPRRSSSMIPIFAAALRGSPRLQSIHYLLPLPNDCDDNISDQLNEIDEINRPMGHIRSFQHGGDELVHARLLLRYTEKSDGARAEDGALAPGLVRIEYEDEDHEECEKMFELRPGGESGWEDFVSFGGRCVPIAVIERMRVAQGAKLGEWEGRGIEVGEAGWAVLTKWRDGQIAKEKRKAEAEEMKN